MDTTERTEILTKSGKTSALSILCIVVYFIGIVGNATAILAIRRGERRVRNRKLVLLLTLLAVNDLTALAGMLVTMVVAEKYPEAKSTQAYCAARVVLRAFGIGSVCIAVTMGAERYLALTRPFLYQKQITYNAVLTTLMVFWFGTVLLTCAPLFNFGAYFDQRNLECIRYRNAVTLSEKAYAYIYVTFGIFLCVILVYCNMSVIRALCAITAPRNGDHPALRRVSKNICRQRDRSINSGSGNDLRVHKNTPTAEEVTFSRLMATLSVLFMICWLPQMVTSVLYLSLNESWWYILKPMSTISDLLMLLNYVFDPFLYVLMRQGRRPSCSAFQLAIAHCFYKQKNSTDSLKTSCCPETVVVSEGSGSELCPLRSMLPPTAPSLSASSSVFRLKIDE